MFALFLDAYSTGEMENAGDLEQLSVQKVCELPWGNKGFLSDPFTFHEGITSISLVGVRQLCR